MKKLTLLLVMWMCYPIYAQQNDILYVRKGENGKIYSPFALLILFP